jgi:branched-chain amino acid transport system ATP-binding protein
MADAQLAVRDVHGWYGESHVLHGMTFDVNPGEVVTLLGRNGAGKTTTMRAIMGMLANRKGSITYGGNELINLKSNRIARQGIAYCPEERGVFASLNVKENLLLPPVVKEGGLDMEKIFQLSGFRARAPSFPAANSRCWLSPAFSARAPSFCSSTSRRRAWRR